MASPDWSTWLSQLFDKLQATQRALCADCEQFLNNGEENNEDDYNWRYWLNIEQQVIAQMSIDRLNREITVIKQRLFKKNTTLNQRLLDTIRELKFLQCKRLKGKFITDRHNHVLGLIKSPFPRDEQDHRAKGSVVSMSRVIMSERYAKTMIDRVCQDYSSIKKDVNALIELRQQLDRCKAYIAKQMLFP